jgi:Ca2+-binding RTX toxin-like protein
MSYLLNTRPHKSLSVKHISSLVLALDAPGETINGGSGNDDLIGTYGDDVMNGHDGHDALSGGDGHDLLWGEAGDDWLIGQNGDDTLFGGTGNDNMYGVEGNDYLIGGAGDDTFFGGPGDDTFIFQSGSGTDVIKDFGVGDRLVLYGVTYSYSDSRGNHNKPVSYYEWFKRIGTVITTDDGRKIFLEKIWPDQLHGEVVDGNWVWYL